MTPNEASCTCCRCRQSLQTKVDILKAQNESLKERLAELEKPVRTVRDALNEIPDPWSSRAIANTPDDYLEEPFDGKPSEALNNRHCTFDWTMADQKSPYWKDVYDFLKSVGK
jgi:hypothetical protein